MHSAYVYYICILHTYMCILYSLWEHFPEYMYIIYTLWDHFPEYMFIMYTLLDHFPHICSGEMNIFGGNDPNIYLGNDPLQQPDICKREYIGEMIHCSNQKYFNAHTHVSCTLTHMCVCIYMCLCIHVCVCEYNTD